MQNQRLSKTLNPIFGSKGFEPPSISLLRGGRTRTDMRNSSDPI
jgi:hypothetical protein